MFCPNCKKELEDDSLFCSYCGEKIEQKKQVFCTQCGAELDESAAFCSKCGVAVNANIPAYTAGPSVREAAATEPQKEKAANGFQWGQVTAFLKRCGAACAALLGTFTAFIGKKAIPFVKKNAKMCAAVAGGLVVIIIVVALVNNSDTPQETTGLPTSETPHPETEVITDTFEYFPNITLVQEEENGAVINGNVASYLATLNQVIINEQSDEKLMRASDEQYAICARSSINKQLKNPSEAVYNDIRVLEKDDYNRAIVWVDVSCMNGMGGYERVYYYGVIGIFRENADGSLTYSGNMYEYFSAHDRDEWIVRDAKELAARTWNVDPAQAAAEGQLFDIEKITSDGNRYKSEGAYGDIEIMQSKEGNGIISVCLQLEKAQLESFYDEKLSRFFDIALPSMFAAAKGQEQATATDDTAAEKIFDRSLLQSLCNAQNQYVGHYENGLAYGCAEQDGILYFFVMPVEKDIYETNKTTLFYDALNATTLSGVENTLGSTLSSEQQARLMSQLQALAYVAMVDDYTDKQYTIDEIFSQEGNLHLYVYAMVDGLFYDAWRPYDWDDDKRADAFMEALGDKCVVTDYTVYIPEENIRAILQELFGEDAIAQWNWEGVFDNGYFVYEEGDPGEWLTLSESGATNWNSAERLAFAFEFEYLEESGPSGSVQFTIVPAPEREYGRIVTGFAFSLQEALSNASSTGFDAAAADITGSWEFWGALPMWEDESYLTNPVPEEELNIDGQGEPALSIAALPDGGYVMNYYSDILKLTKDASGWYNTGDDGYGSFILVDENTLHQETRGDLTVYKRMEEPSAETSDYTGSWNLVHIVGEPELSNQEYSFLCIFEDGTFSHIMEIDNSELWLEGYQGYYGTWYMTNSGVLSFDDGLSLADSYWAYCGGTRTPENTLEIRYTNRDGISYTMHYEKVSDDPNYLLAG